MTVKQKVVNKIDLKKYLLIKMVLLLKLKFQRN